jgi:hypothetical protein
MWIAFFVMLLVALHGNGRARDDDDWYYIPSLVRSELEADRTRTPAFTHGKLRPNTGPGERNIASCDAVDAHQHSVPYNSAPRVPGLSSPAIVATRGLWITSFDYGKMARCAADETADMRR